MMNIEIEVERVDRGIEVVRVIGEIDLHTAQTLRNALDEAAVAKPWAVILNLAGATYLSSSGIEVMMECHFAMSLANARMLIVGAGGMVLDTLRMVGVLELAESGTSARDAIRKLHQPLDPARA